MKILSMKQYKIIEGLANDIKHSADVEARLAKEAGDYEGELSLIYQNTGIDNLMKHIQKRLVK